VPQPITPNLNPAQGLGTSVARRDQEDPKASARRAFFEMAMQAPASATSASAPAKVSASSPIREPILRPTLEAKPFEPEKPKRYVRPGSLLDIYV
jgi:hypothetical protein